MAQDRYNGWTNFETWLVNMWLDNDGHNEDLRTVCKGLTESTAADIAKTYVEGLQDALGLPESGMFVDMINGALREVNWREIASHLVED